MTLFLWLAILGFCASVVVHGSSFLGQTPVGMNRAWPLHIGIFVVFIPMILMQRRRAGGPRPGSMREAFPHAPAWMLQALGALGAYTVATFLGGLVLLGAFTGEKIVNRNGQHLAVRKGVVDRPVGEAEYTQHRAREVRLFSGHWMLFYWAAAVGISSALRRRKAATPPSSPQGLPTGDGRGYLLRPSPRLSPRAHATLIVFVRVACFVALPVALAMCIPLANEPNSRILRALGYAAFILILPAALFGAVVPPRWVARLLPARCPSCGGRAYCDGALSSGRGTYNVTYACRECGRGFRPDGTPA